MCVYVCALQRAAAAAVFHTLSGFQLNENNAATRHMTTPPFIKQHVPSTRRHEVIIDYLLY